MTTMKRMKHIAAKAGMCLLAGGYGVSGGIAQADEQPLPYVMTVVSNQAEGERMLEGEYETAIRRIEPPFRGSAGGFATSNNLCVAYVKTRDLERAVQACDDALEEAGRASIVTYYEGSRRYDDMAVALTNRGVVRAVTGDLEGARRDFREAVTLSGEFEAAATNLALLGPFPGEEAPTAAAANR